MDTVEDTYPDSTGAEAYPLLVGVSSRDKRRTQEEETHQEDQEDPSMEDPEEILSVEMEDPEDHLSGEDSEATHSGEEEDPEMDQEDHLQGFLPTRGTFLRGSEGEEAEHHHLEAHQHRQPTRDQIQTTRTSIGSQTSRHSLNTGKSRNGPDGSPGCAICCMHRAWRRYWTSILYPISTVIGLSRRGDASSSSHTPCWPKR